MRRGSHPRRMRYRQHAIPARNARLLLLWGNGWASRASGVSRTAADGRSAPKASMTLEFDSSFRPQKQ
jgi:hypothetical protein